MASFKTNPISTLPQETLDQLMETIETERARAENAERMYEVLKKIHENCTEEFRVTQNQTQKLFGESEQRLLNADETLRELRRTVVDQSRELSELRPNVLTPQKQQVLRLSVQTELDRQYQRKLRTLQDETTVLKSKVAGLMYENSALQADLATREADFKRAKSDLILKYDRKLDDWKREKDAAALAVPAVDVGRYSQLQRDNEELEARVKAQQVEMDSMQQSGSKRAEEAHTSYKALAQRNADLKLKAENLKAELEVQKSHTSTLRTRVSELTNESTQLSQMNSLLNDEKLTAESNRESLIYRHQNELASERTKIAADRTNLLKETATVATEVKKLEGELEHAKQAVELQRGSVATKKHDTQMKLNQLGQVHATKIGRVEQEKHEVELKFVSVQQKLLESERTFQTKEDGLSEQLRRSEAASASLLGELDAARKRLEEFKNLKIAFNGLTKEHTSVQQEAKGLLGQISSMENLFQTLAVEKRSLEQEILTLHVHYNEQERLLSEIQSRHQTQFEELQRNWNDKRLSYAAYVKGQLQKIKQGKDRYLRLSEKQRSIRRKCRLFREKARSAVAELICVLNAKNALLDLAKDSVSPAEYKAVVDELIQLKQKMSRLKSIAVPQEVSATAVRTGHSQILSAKSTEEHFDLVTNKATQDAKTPSSGNGLEDLFDRLRQLGLTQEKGDFESSDTSDIESILADSDDDRPIPSIAR